MGDRNRTFPVYSTILIYVFVLALGVNALGQGLSSNPAAPATAPSKGAPPSEPEDKPPLLTLADAAMCEKVQNLTPTNSAIVFSASMGQVYCFTRFDPVPKDTFIYHRWYHADDLSTQIRLKLHAPSWSTFSTIQLRENDKGPWRVEISDQQGRIFSVLRFSITD